MKSYKSSIQLTICKEPPRSLWVANSYSCGNGIVFLTGIPAITPLPDCFKKARFSEILVGGNDGGIPENGGGCNESVSRVIIDL